MSNEEKEEEPFITKSVETALSNKSIRLLKKIGEGTYAKVYLARYKDGEKNQDTELACKIIDTSNAPQDFVKKFLPRELDIIVKLNHPHIINIQGVFHRKTQFFILMECAENGDLLQHLLRHGELTERNGRMWIRQLALALQYLHSIKIAHRDLKCENVLISSNLNVKLSDFGFARLCVDVNDHVVLSETYCGSLSYASPEVLRGEPYNPRQSDIWSLGIVLFVMYNVCMPFHDNHAKKLYIKQINRMWKFKSEVLKKVSKECVNAVDCMMEPNCDKRITAAGILKLEWINRGM
ncbi:testis-specific serine/threonine-protein kinase 1-like [Arctopsyche grandis]|uniref:testis-specific serine/threonine-protein kinase 1-like n=1 Tax=Arctopsyche grandis TaxID=121162 RepID=UPI00406D6562